MEIEIGMQNERFLFESEVTGNGKKDLKAPQTWKQHLTDSSSMRVASTTSTSTTYLSIIVIIIISFLIGIHQAF